MTAKTPWDHTNSKTKYDQTAEQVVSPEIIGSSMRYKHFRSLIDGLLDQRHFFRIHLCPVFRLSYQAVDVDPAGQMGKVNLFVI